MFAWQENRTEYTGQEVERMEATMTDKQYQSILNLIAAFIEKCKTEDEIKEAAQLIREITKNFGTEK